MNISGLQSGGQFGDGESKRFVFQGNIQIKVEIIDEDLDIEDIEDWDTFDISLLGKCNTKKLSDLLSSQALTVNVRKIVQYLIFVRVATKIEKITNNQTVKDSFCTAITSFRKLIFFEYNWTRTNENFDKIENAIKTVYKLAINPSELDVKIMATHVEKSYCLPCAKWQEWVMKDSMMQKATRLLSNYQTAFDHIRVLDPELINKRHFIQ